MRGATTAPRCLSSLTNSPNKSLLTHQSYMAAEHMITTIFLCVLTTSTVQDWGGEAKCLALAWGGAWHYATFRLPVTL